MMPNRILFAEQGCDWHTPPEFFALTQVRRKAGKNKMRPKELSGVPTELPPTELPEPNQILNVVLRDGSIMVARQHGDVSGPRLYVSHGNGMAADLYYPYWRRFLDDFEVIVYDFRNHGWNPVSDFGRHTFPNFVFDNESLLDGVDAAWGPKPAFGAFHSMSAVTALLQALRAGPRWAGLVLFDPPLSPPLGHPLEALFLQGQVSISNRAAARQESYGSYADFESVLRHASLFAQFQEECYALYAAATLRPADDGRVVLRCPREYEARVYIANGDPTIDLAMPGFPSPLKVIAGDPERADVAPPSLVCRELFPAWGLPYESLSGTSHFLQLEAPDACADATMEFFGSLGVI